MRHLHAIIYCLIVFTACRPSVMSEQDTEAPVINLPKTTVDSVKVITDGNYCYKYVHQRDTSYMSFSLDEGEINGQLLNNFFEKDKSQGTIHGYLKEDIMHIKYRFESEGLSSVRRMYFKVRGNLLINGEGEEVQQGDSTYIKDEDQIKYTGLVYSLIPCN